MKSKLIFATTCAIAAASRVFAGTNDFEAVAVNTDVGSFYQGVTYSTDNVINTSPAFPGFGQHEITSTASSSFLTATFNTTQTSFSFYYTTFFNLVVTAYGTGGNTLFSQSYGNNTDALNTGVATYATLSGTGIKSVSFDGAFSGYFTVDNFAAPGISGAANAPEATSTLALFGVAGLGLFAMRRKLAV